MNRAYPYCQATVAITKKKIAVSNTHIWYTDVYIALLVPVKCMLHG